MITTVTLNVSVDKAYYIKGIVVPGTVARVQKCVNSAGGKGLNVSRIIDFCGEEVLATGFAGGFNGAYVEDMLKKDGIPSRFTKTQSETRSCINILAEDESSTEYLTRYIIENKDKEIMPFQIGGHPGFHCPLYKEESYEDYELVFEQKETCTVPTPVTETGLIDMEHRSEFLKDTDTLPLKHDLFSVDAVILDQLKSRAVTLKSKKHNKGIRIDFNQFPYLILWSTAKEADFVALEPWIGLSTCSDEGDKFEEKRNIQYAQAGEVKEYEFHINIL